MDIPNEIMWKLARYFASGSFPSEQHKEEARRLVDNMNDGQYRLLKAMVESLIKKSKTTILYEV